LSSTRRLAPRTSTGSPTSRLPTIPSDSRRAVFTALGITDALSASVFASGAEASDADDRIIYDTTSGALYYDADGTGLIGKVQFATLVSHPGGVTNADFVVI
jgi:Ca2+-binding RTX toxin-like protein